MTNQTIDIYIKQKLDNQILSVPAILAIIVFTKEYYSHNDELRQFTEGILGADYKDYLFKSRTLLYSRIIKDFYVNNQDTKSLVKKINAFIKKENNETNNQVKEKDYQTEKNSSSKKRDSQQDIIKKWRHVIDSHD